MSPPPGNSATKGVPRSASASDNARATAGKASSGGGYGTLGSDRRTGGGGARY